MLFAYLSYKLEYSVPPIVMLMMGVLTGAELAVEGTLLAICFF